MVRRARTVSTAAGALIQPGDRGGSGRWNADPHVTPAADSLPLLLQAGQLVNEYEVMGEAAPQGRRRSLEEALTALRKVCLLLLPAAGGCAAGAV